MGTSILHQSKFEPLSNGHGGNRRTAQIVEIMTKAGLPIEPVQPDQSIHPEMLSRVKRYWAGMQAVRRYRLKLPSFYRVVSYYGCQHLSYRNTTEQFQKSKVFVWEETDNYITLNIARQANLKILALPHNLESLAVTLDSSSTHSRLSSKFITEVQQLSKADAVFCISREEQWLLRLWGLEAKFLPYYPPEDILKNLKDIRENRKFSDKKRFLIIGTVDNPPTRIGMVEQLEWLKGLRREAEFKIDVAGYGTESLSDSCTHPDFNLLGAVDNEALHRLMVESKAVLVHQRAGIGALTRIPEMLIAGLPVIVNGNACRSAFNYRGVHCYDTPVELLELMKTTLDIPEVLPPPKSAQNDFICQLQILLRGSFA